MPAGGKKEKWVIGRRNPEGRERLSQEPTEWGTEVAWQFSGGNWEKPDLLTFERFY